MQSSCAVFPSGKAQGILMSTVLWKLGNGFDEVLLVGLAKRETIEPTLAT
jgi:hypothetical protein